RGLDGRAVRRAAERAVLAVQRFGDEFGVHVLRVAGEGSAGDAAPAAPQFLFQAVGQGSLSGAVESFDDHESSHGPRRYPRRLSASRGSPPRCAGGSEAVTIAPTRSRGRARRGRISSAVTI